MTCKTHTWDNNPRRGHRWCKRCRHRQFRIQSEWVDAMTLGQFTERWARFGGTTPETTFVIECAMPFEFNSYESWNQAYRVTFTAGPEFIIGWQSRWVEDLCFVDWKLKRAWPEFDVPLWRRMGI